MGGNGSLSPQGPVFEFDPAKSRANEKKHGISFAGAQDLCCDPDLLRIQARAQGEPRYIFLGRLDGRIWAAIATYRRGSIRLISVRRARPEEVALYEVQ
jgi:uncharacterized protein